MDQATIDKDAFLQETPGVKGLLPHGQRLADFARSVSWRPEEILGFLESEGTLLEWMQAPLPHYGLSPGELWRHSLAAALACDHARAFCHVPVAPEAFVAALFHEVGKIVLGSHLTKGTSLLMHRAKQRLGLTDDQAEMDILKMCHGELGARLVTCFSMGPEVAAAIRYHHSPILAPEAESRRLATQVALGDVVAATIGAGCGTGGTVPAFNAAAAGALGITQEGFSALCREVEQRLGARRERTAA